MKIWAQLYIEHKVAKDIIIEFTGKRPRNKETWRQIIGELCDALNQIHPVMLNKHINQLVRLSRTCFIAADFLEPTEFTKLEVQILPDETKADI